MMNYILYFIMFLSAIFALCYHFKHEGFRVILIIFFVVCAFVRMSVYGG